MHGRKSVLSIGMVRAEFGELTRGEVTRFHCIPIHYNNDSIISVLQTGPR